MSFNLKNIGVDLVLEDSSGKAALDLANSYIDSEYFVTNVVHSMEDAKGHMESGKSCGIIRIPENFSKSFAKRDNKTAIQIIGDGSDPNTASYVEGYAQGIFTKWMLSSSFNQSSKKPLSPTLNIVDRLWFNPSSETVNFIIAGILTMILSIVGTFLTSLVVAREWERGTMEAMIATPISIWEIIISKIIPYFVLASVSFILAIIYSVSIFNVPIQCSLFPMVLLNCVFITVSLLIGLIISTTAKDQFVASMAAFSITFMPTMMLSGFIFEIKSMPMWIQCLTYIFPARYYVSSIRTLLMVGDIWTVLLRDLAVLCLMMVVFFFILKRKTKKSVE
jgi:ABC-2 type transport system permease protein